MWVEETNTKHGVICPVLTIINIGARCGITVGNGGVRKGLTEEVTFVLLLKRVDLPGEEEPRAFQLVRTIYAMHRAASESGEKSELVWVWRSRWRQKGHG